MSTKTTSDSGEDEVMSEVFESCSPCLDPHKETRKIPLPHWWVIRADGKIATTCKSSWGAFSCPNSLGNKRVSEMTKEEMDEWGASLFPLMDVAQYFITIFLVPKTLHISDGGFSSD